MNDLPCGSKIVEPVFMEDVKIPIEPWLFEPDWNDVTFLILSLFVLAG